MSGVKEIKEAIDKLSFQERCELMAMLNPPTYDGWDEEMVKDAASGGKLDRLRDAAHEDYEAGKWSAWPFQEVFVHLKFWKLYAPSHRKWIAGG